MRQWYFAAISNVSVHEVWPGHYLQFLYGKTFPSDIRKVLGANSNSEGWAHYCEQMVIDEGFHADDPRYRLAQIQDALLRDARFVAGIQMHRGNFTLDQSREFFVKEGFQSPRIADIETKRGTSDPTYLYYTLGKLQILKLREDMSVEMPNGRLDCGTQGFPPAPPPAAGEEKKPTLPAPQKERFRGVRIFDISDIRAPKQIAAVQTCRGSHTHTLVVDPKDKNNVYIYVSGTSFVRQGEELPGCSGEAPDKDPNTALFRIDVIKVPLAAPQDARVVSSPRVFIDPRTNALNGLNNGGTHGKDGEKLTDSDQCHDITVFSSIGLAAGACSGNGIVLDIKDPVHPKRLDAVNDPNYSYWHSASFSNDGTKVVFTDEWGGGLGARCRANDPNKWGADAVFHLKDNKLNFASYYKLPAAQGDTENCVAHNGSLVPVPGRDIKIQAWYQGGISMTTYSVWRQLRIVISI